MPVKAPQAFGSLTAATSFNTSSLSLGPPPRRPVQTPLKPSPPLSHEVKFSNMAPALLLPHLHPFPAATTITETAGMKAAAQAALASFETRCLSLVDKLLSLLHSGHSSTSTASSGDTGKACVVSPPAAVPAACVRPLAIANALAMLGSCRCHSMVSDRSGCGKVQEDPVLTDGMAVATKHSSLPLKVDFPGLHKPFDVYSLSVSACLAKARVCPSLSPSLSNPVAAMPAMHPELQCNARSPTMTSSSTTTTIGLFSVVHAAAKLGDNLVSFDTLLNHDCGGSSRSCSSSIATNAKDTGACVPAFTADDGMNLALIWSRIASFKYSLDSFAAVSDCLRVSGSLNIVWLDSSAFAKALSGFSHTVSLGWDFSLAFVFGSLALEGPASVAGHGMAKQLFPADFLLANRSPVALLPRNWCSTPCQCLHNFQVCKPSCARHCNNVHSAC